MDVTFSIKYRAELGQKLCITGAISELGCWDETQAIELTQVGQERWSCTVSIDGRRKELAYYYLVKDETGTVLRREWKRMHRLRIKAPFRSIYMDDHWINRPPNSPFFSSAFYDVIYRHEEYLCAEIGVERELLSERVVVQIYAPTVPRDSRLYLSGATPKLGRWDIDQAIPMCYLGKGEWATYINVDRSLLTGLEVEFKFFMATEERTQIRWEEGSNRIFIMPEEGEYDAIYVAGMSFREGSFRPRFAGVVAPLFSLRSRTDYGIGDFATLRTAIDWASSTGLRVLQLLPINDTTFYRDWRDSYPYNAISVDALNPIFADISALPKLKSPEAKALLSVGKALSQSPTVCYPEVQSFKEQYLWLHYQECGAATMKKRPFRQFVQQHADWLLPYVAFCVLRDKYPGLSPSAWSGHEVFHPMATNQLLDSDEHRERAGYHKYVQFLLSQQLQSVRTYAEEQGILLKGDIPIGVSPNSVETWVHPELFNLELSAGAPPDDFAIDGQNWGFPTYNWEIMQRDGMLWWRRRFERMAAYFKAFRIDHILGFFRIWEIPRTQYSGLLGHFSPAKPYSWEEWQQRLDIPAGSRDRWVYPTLHSSELRGENASLWERAIEAGVLLPTDSEEYFRLCSAEQRHIESLAHQVWGVKTDVTPIIDLCREIALVEDSHQRGFYHPRIAFASTKLYSHLPKPQQELWTRYTDDYYYVRHNEYWRQTAMQRLLPLLESTDMLVCAEDLGMIPDAVPEVLNELQILTLDLERMPKHYYPTGWTPMEEIPYVSVCTTSTHDMPPLRLWWQSLREDEKELYLRSQLPHEGLSKNSPVEEVCASIVRSHLETDAMFAIIPLADLMSMDKRLHIQSPEGEQINHPENPRQRWEWRMPITIEELQERYSDWSACLASLLRASGRD